MLVIIPCKNQWRFTIIIFEKYYISMIKNTEIKLVKKKKEEEEEEGLERKETWKWLQVWR